MLGPRLVLCLGNPGPAYSLTWHNAGFWTADVLAAEAGVSFSNAGLFSAVTLPCGLELAKPMTFMNESGRAAATLLRLHDMSPGDLLVVNKTDYLGMYDFDMEALKERVVRLNPGIRICPVSCRTGQGIDDWAQWLAAEIEKTKQGGN